MVDVVKCKKGHYYDRQTYQECPHCASGWLDNDSTIEYKTKVAFLAQQYVEQCGKLNKTTSTGTGYSPVAGVSASPAQPVLTQNTSKRSVTETVTGNTAGGEKSRSIAGIVPSVSQSSPYKEDMKTTSFAAGSENNYMVTGWIVCIDGPDEGYSYNLHYGHNTIGCGLENQICLSGETGASEGTHCSIVYEDHKNQFYLITEQEQIVYLNGECETNPMRLVTGDLICVGSDVFEFVAFCRGERKWKKKNRKEGI